MELNLEDYNLEITEVKTIEENTGGTPGRKKGTKKSKKVEKTVSQMNEELAKALRESELGDSIFLKQYIRSREVSKLRRALNQVEKETAEVAIAQAKRMEDKKKEIIATFETKDFTYVWWSLIGGGTFKEIHARPGLRIGLDARDLEIEQGFNITIEG
jgi:hypothetical protein